MKDKTMFRLMPIVQNDRRVMMFLPRGRVLLQRRPRPKPMLVRLARERMWFSLSRMILSGLRTRVFLGIGIKEKLFLVVSLKVFLRLGLFDVYVLICMFLVLLMLRSMEGLHASPFTLDRGYAKDLFPSYAMFGVTFILPYL